MAVRRSRQKLLGPEEVDLDAHEASQLPSPDEHLLSFDRLTRSAEALQRLKPQEVRALWMKAAGNSYLEIAEATGWTYTKDYVRNNRRSCADQQLVSVGTSSRTCRWRMERE